MHNELTQSDIKKMEEEIEYRKLVVRKNAIRAVQEAREQGDLSENFEYYAAKKDKNKNESRIRYLERMIRTAVVVSDDSKEDEVGINNTVTDLQKPVSEFPEQASLKFIELDSEMGWHIYRRSVLFLLITAAHELSPEAEVVAQFTANKGLFIEISLPHDAPLTADAVRNLEKHMREIIAENRPVKRRTMSREDAVRLFKESRQIEKANLIASLKLPNVSIYRCGGYCDYLYGAMIGSTGHLGKFALDIFDRLRLIDRLDMNVDGNGVVELQKVRKQLIAQLRRENLHKRNRAEMPSDAEAPAVL